MIYFAKPEDAHDDDLDVHESDGDEHHAENFMLCSSAHHEVVSLGFVAHCCSVWSLPPIKDGLQQFGEGCDGRLVQIS